jgi:Fic family protein
MNIEAFGEFKTGELVPISPEGKYHDYAFVPASLPPHWEPDKATYKLIIEARDRVATLNGTGGNLPNPSLLLRPLQRREAIKSNTIEGTYVTPNELLLFEMEENQAKNPNDERRNNWREVIHYGNALDSGCDLIREGEQIDRKLFCRLHRQLLRTTRGKDKDPGQIRDKQVYVEAGRRYIPPPEEYLDQQLANLEAYLTDSEDDALVRAFIAHYQFEAIHPFKDGNGRLGRLILSLCIYKWLKHSHAWLYISEFFEKNRREYIDRLFAVSARGEWDEWIKFCLVGAIEQAESGIAMCQRLSAIKRKYEQLAGHLSSRMNAIIARLMEFPFIEPNRLRKDLKISYHTARADLQKLVDVGILHQLPDVRPISYAASELYDAAYGNH